jgi:hypothetical protein
MHHHPGKKTLRIRNTRLTEDTGCCATLYNMTIYYACLIYYPGARVILIPFMTEGEQRQVIGCRTRLCDNITVSNI